MILNTAQATSRPGIRKGAMGIEILIGLALAFVVLGPQRLHLMLGNLGRAKAHLEKASQETREQP